MNCDARKNQLARQMGASPFLAMGQTGRGTSTGRDFRPAGTSENSPVLQHWVDGKMRRVPQGTAEIFESNSVVPSGTRAAPDGKPSTEVLRYFRSSLRDAWGNAGSF